MVLNVRFVLILILAVKVSSEQWGFLTPINQRPCDTFQQLNNCSNKIEEPESFYQKLNNRLDKIEEQMQKIWNNKNSKGVNINQRPCDTFQQLNNCSNKIEEPENFYQKLNNRLDKIEEQIQKIWNNKNSKGVKMPQNGLPENCLEVLESGKIISGIYTIQPKSSPKPFLVFCDMETRDGGWTYFLNRFDGSVDFYLNWENYKQGFGYLGGEFWLGLQHLHELTGDGEYQLLVEMEDWDDKKVYAHYNSFSIGSENEGFSLKILGGFSGHADDSFWYSAGAKFTTKDKDRCAVSWGGAWWYKDCMMMAHLTGKYMKRLVSDDYRYKIMFWDTFRGSFYSLKKAKMMVKPAHR
ncbi:angiopoietin-related protein 1-like [Tribolium madens]|uniref:angiopoietin-related protein 1-like n=1 Tax=Tribolium madens TaxID=41895 RepID=UPI001CF73191|nr:angiopoietin-related protein 1-like [Tribolium madens]